MPAQQHRRALDLLFITDPVPSLNPAHDTSVALMEAAQARGHRVLVTTMRELSASRGEAAASCSPLTIAPAQVRDGRWQAEADWFTLGPARRQPLAGTDAVFVRTDPPVDAAYLRGTFVLDFAEMQGTLVVNSPRGLRHANEHIFALRWPDLCPATVLTADMREIADITAQWGTAVVKPTDGMAGRGVMMLRRGDPNLMAIIETATVRGRDQVIVQRYLDRAAEGDRRVMVLDGEPIGAVRRIASTRGGEFRCNMAVGASVSADAVTARDKEICARLAPALSELGLALVGIDVIGDSLTEVNVTSPTGIREIDALTGSRLSDQVLAWVERRAGA